MAWRWGLVTANAKADWHARHLTGALAEFGAVEVLDPSELRVLAGHTQGRDVLLLLAKGQDALRFDAVIIGRIVGPKADADIQLDAARALELIGVPCLNRVGPMLSAQDKLWTAALLAKAGVPTPLCSSVPRPSDVVIATTEIGSGVAKPLFGSLGQGIFRCDDAKARTRLARGVRHEPFLVQRFVTSGRIDYRLFVVGDRVEACIRREALEGEWRTNIAQGGRAVAVVPHRSWRDIAVEAARTLDLDFAGVDLAVGEDGPTVLEVNGFPNFRGVYQATGRDMAKAIAVRALRLAKANRRPTPSRLRA
jgi:tetrahydromethanopterin:alpha-L-glutamate ligase